MVPLFQYREIQSHDTVYLGPPSHMIHMFPQKTVDLFTVEGFCHHYMQFHIDPLIGPPYLMMISILARFPGKSHPLENPFCPLSLLRLQQEHIHISRFAQLRYRIGPRGGNSFENYRRNSCLFQSIHHIVGEKHQMIALLNRSLALMFQAAPDRFWHRISLLHKRIQQRQHRMGLRQPQDLLPASIRKRLFRDLRFCSGKHSSQIAKQLIFTLGKCHLYPITHQLFPSIFLSDP